MSPRKLSEALPVLEPTLSAFGYGDGKRVVKKRFWPFGVAMHPVIFNEFDQIGAAKRTQSGALAGRLHL